MDQLIGNKIGMDFTIHNYRCSGLITRRLNGQYGNGFIAHRAKIKLKNKFYFVLMASTGFIFAAIDAGIIPEIMPSTIQILKAKAMMPGAMTMANGITELKATVSIHTKNKPNNPPTIHKKADSNKKLS